MPEQPAVIDRTGGLAEQAAEHLIFNFQTLDPVKLAKLPVFVAGEGCWVWDSHGRKYFDAASSLGTMTLGYGYGLEVGAAIQAQLAELPFWPCWGASHPAAIRLAAALAEISPPGLDHVYFVQSGSEANEAALKMARQYHRANGEERRYKVLARRTAYHGMTQGALALTGVAGMRAPFEPLMTGVRHLTPTIGYRRPEGESEEQWTAVLLAEARATLLQENPELVAAIVVEPVQASGGCVPPPAGYLPGLRALCDEFGVLLIADEVITGFGRLGEWFGCHRYGMEPDLITFAKGATAGHAPLGGMLVSDRVLAPLAEAGVTFMHGSTFSGHPGSTAAALKVQEIIRRDRVLENVREREPELRAGLEDLKRHPIVGDVRGGGFLWAVELVRDRETKEPFSDEEAKIVLDDFLSPRCLEQGLICRGDGRGDPVIAIGPPLIASAAELERMVDVLNTVIAETSARAAALS